MDDPTISTNLSENHDRPSWQEYFKQITKYTASRSPCQRLQVGCIRVKDNRIISQGYNGIGLRRLVTLIWNILLDHAQSISSSRLNFMM